MFYTLTCFSFWLLITWAKLISFDLICSNKGKTTLVGNFKLIEILQRLYSYNQLMPVVFRLVLSHHGTCKLLQSWQQACFRDSCWLSFSEFETQVLALVWSRAFLGRWNTAKWRKQCQIEYIRSHLRTRSCLP
jgi:hypothetical protein